MNGSRPLGWRWRATLRRPLANAAQSALGVGVLAALLGVNCGCRPQPPQSNTLNASASPFRFVDVAAQAGIKCANSNGVRHPLNILDTTGPGIAWIDYDRDGWPDLFVIGGNPAHAPGTPPPQNHLFHNNRNGTFTDVTAQAGVAGIGQYGMGVTVGDYDGDGYDDLYVTCYGANLLFHNNGNGTFTDVAKKAGVSGPLTLAGAPKWSTGAAWFDADGDGKLDLYVCNYVAFSPQSLQLCHFGQLMSTCPPHQYAAQHDLFYHNRGDGTFEDWTERAGFAKPKPGRGLGVLPFDADGDGKPDVLVANDGTPNFMFRNLGKGKFSEIGLQSGLALGETGSEMANMGLDVGDYEGNGKPGLIMTHFQGEPNTLYRQRGPFNYEDVTTLAGLGTTTWNYLGWGCGFIDANLDGKLEMVFINGHVQDNIAQLEASTSWAQTPQLFQPQNGRFMDVSAQSGPAFQQKLVGRGCAFADYDHDGRVDIAVATNGGGVQLWHNESQHGHYLQVQLQGLPPNRAALGARLRVTANGHTQVSQLISGRSYLSDSDRRLTFGLGAATRVEQLQVLWPGGSAQILKNLLVDECVTVKQP